MSSHDPTEYVSRFYSDSRFDALDKRIVKDLELMEHYLGAEGGIVSMKATFFIGEKKFGPADIGKGNKEIAKIIGA
jgi:hypothetical protein